MEMTISSLSGKTISPLAPFYLLGVGPFSCAPEFTLLEDLKHQEYILGDISHIISSQYPSVQRL